MYPVGTPKNIVDKVSADINEIIAQPDMIEAMRTGALDAVIMKPAEFSRFLEVEAGKWKKMISDAKIKTQ
jgi:tripartite-type tricarboxylate transporter receptor subunit TctC